MKTPNLPTSLLCLAIAPPEIRAQACRRTRSGLAMPHRCLLPSLRLTADDPELVGRELRQRLQEADLPRGKAVVLLPSSWFETQQVSLEGIPAESHEAFLQLQAERLSGGADAGLWGHHQVVFPDGRTVALVTSLSAERAGPVCAALRAAGVQPLFLAPMAAFPAPAEVAGAVVLSAVPQGLEFGVFVQGMPLLFRSLPADLPAEALVRELRLTLGGLGVAGRKIFMDAPPAVAEALRQAGFQLQPLPVSTSGGFPTAEAALLSLVEKGCVPGGVPVAPPVSRWKRLWLQRRRLMTAVGGAAAVVALLLLAVLGRILYIQWLEAQSAKVHAEAEQIGKIQAQATALAGWVRPAPERLLLLKRITEAFPEEGSAWCERIDVRSNNEVILTASARSASDWLATRERLGRTPGITEFHVQNLKNREKDGGVQFTVKFTWNSKMGGQP